MKLKQKVTSPCMVYIKNKCKKCEELFVKQYKNSIGKSKGKDFLLYCRHCYMANNIKKNYGTKKNFYDQRNAKSVKTYLEKYGCENPSQVEEIKKKKEQTSFENYGVPYHTMLPEEMENMEKIFNEKYGVSHPLQIKEAKDKFINTITEKYSDKNSMDEINKKREKTNLEKYNVINVGLLFSPYKYRGINFDSSWELAFYIYHKDKGHTIIREPCVISYKENGKLKKYIPDFKVGNKLYEIKGDHLLTFYKNGNIKSLKGSHEKYLCMKHNKVHIIYSKTINEYINYVENKYGKDYLKNLSYSYKCSTTKRQTLIYC